MAGILFGVLMKRIYWILGINLFTISTSLLMLPPLLKTIASQLDFNVDMGGWLIAAYGFFSGASALVSGHFINKKGTLFFIKIGTVGMIVSSILACISTSFLFFLISQIAISVFYGILLTNILTYISDATAYENRGKTIGITMLGSFMGQVIGNPLSLYLSSLGHFRYSYLFLILCTLISFVAVFFLVPQSPKHKENKESFFKGYKKIMQHPTAFVLLSLMVIMWIGLYIFTSFYAVWLRETFIDKTDKDLAYLFLIGSIAALIASPLIGRLSDRMRKTRIVSLFNFILGLCFLLGPWVTDNFYLHFPLFFLASFAAAARLAPFVALMSNVLPPSERGLLFGLGNAVQRVGITIGGVLSGIFYMVGYSISGMIAFFLFAIVSVVLLNVRENQEEVK